MYTKTGKIYKQSRYLKQWRQRECFLTKTHLITYEPDTSGKPTESIPLETILYVDDKHTNFHSIFVPVVLYRESLLSKIVRYSLMLFVMARNNHGFKAQVKQFIKKEEAIRERLDERQSTDYRDIYEFRSDIQLV